MGMFLFFNGLASVFIKHRTYGNARDDIGGDVAQYEHNDSITLEEGVGFSQM